MITFITVKTYHKTRKNIRQNIVSRCDMKSHERIHSICMFSINFPLEIIFHVSEKKVLQFMHNFFNYTELSLSLPIAQFTAPSAYHISYAILHRDVTHILINFNCFSRQPKKYHSWMLVHCTCALWSLIWITKSRWRDVCGHYLAMSLHISHRLELLLFSLGGFWATPTILSRTL